MSVKPQKLFSSNPFHSPAGELVAKATDASLLKENWALIKLVCDYVTVNSSATKDAVKAIKKRLHKNKNFNQINITLSLLETCVKKCGLKFRKYIMTEDFCMNNLVSVVSSKNLPDVLLTQRILGIIQEWAYVFSSNSELIGVMLVYQKLLDGGACFPPPKPVSIVSVNQKSKKFKQTIPAKLSAQQETKLVKDLSIVKSNIKVLSEMLIELNPLTCSAEDFLLMQEINKTCRAMHGRVFELISQVNGNDFTALLLTTMDDLNNVLLRYDRFEKFRDARNSDYVFPESLSSTSSQQSVSTGAENVYVKQSPSHPSTTSSNFAPDEAIISGHAFEKFRAARNSGYVFSESLTSASAIQSVSTGVENVYVEQSPSHLSTTSSNFAPDEAIISGHASNLNIYSVASDVEELSLESKVANSASSVSYSMMNEHASFINNNNVEENHHLSNCKIKHDVEDNSCLSNDKMKHSIGRYVPQNISSWDEIG